MTDQNSKNPGPFKSTDSDAHRDPSTSSSSSPPNDFMDLLVSAGMPVEDGYAALATQFLHHGQASLSDDALLAVYEGARATSADSPLYPGTQSKLIRNAGIDPKSATRVVRQLNSAGLFSKTAEGHLSLAPFWAKYPVGKDAQGGPAQGFLRAPAWLLFHRKALGWTPRDLRLLLLLGSFYRRQNTNPWLSGAQAGDMLGLARSQAAENLAGLVARARLTPGFPEGSRTPRGYGFNGLCRLVSEKVAEQQLGYPAAPTMPTTQSTPTLTPEHLELFGDPRGNSVEVPQNGGPTRRKVAEPNSRHRSPAQLRLATACAKAVKQGISQIAEDHQDRALGIARQVMTGGSLTDGQWRALLLDTARAVSMDWSPKENTESIEARLGEALGVYVTLGDVALTVTCFEGPEPTREEIRDMARRHTDIKDVEAELLARGMTPKIARR
jgi:hypothetical protein